MRASQFVRRGLVAAAAASVVMVGVAHTASAQSAADDDDAVVVNARPGYSSTFVPSVTDPVGVILVANTGPGLQGTVPVAVQFLPDMSGATVITPGPGGSIINVDSNND